MISGVLAQLIGLYGTEAGSSRFPDWLGLELAGRAAKRA